MEQSSIPRFKLPKSLFLLTKRKGGKPVRLSQGMTSIEAVEIRKDVFVTTEKNRTFQVLLSMEGKQLLSVQNPADELMLNDQLKEYDSGSKATNEKGFGVVPKSPKPQATRFIRPKGGAYGKKDRLWLHEQVQPLGKKGW